MLSVSLGIYRIGVHIADVCYFLQEDTNLDLVAAKRATSVYLTQKVCIFILMDTRSNHKPDFS